MPFPPLAARRTEGLMGLPRALENLQNLKRSQWSSGGFREPQRVSLSGMAHEEALRRPRRPRGPKRTSKKLPRVSHMDAFIQITLCSIINTSVQWGRGIADNDWPQSVFRKIK